MPAKHSPPNPDYSISKFRFSQTCSLHFSGLNLLTGGQTDCALMHGIFFVGFNIWKHSREEVFHSDFLRNCCNSTSFY